MKYRPLPPGSGLAVAIETATLLTACTVTVLVGSLLQDFAPFGSPWLLLAAAASVTAGMVTGLALDTAATALLAAARKPKP